MEHTRVRFTVDGYIQVQLSYAQIDLARQVAIGRSAKGKSSSNTRPFSGELRIIDNDIKGCLGELAVAVGTSRTWNNQLENWEQQKTKGDVDFLEVRTTSRQDHGLHLYTWDDKRSNRPFVLVEEHLMVFTIIGWCIGRHGMIPEFWQDGTTEGRKQASYEVPRNRLRSPAELQVHSGTDMLWKLAAEHGVDHFSLCTEQEQEFVNS